MTALRRVPASLTVLLLAACTSETATSTDSGGAIGSTSTGNTSTSGANPTTTSHATTTPVPSTTGDDTTAADATTAGPTTGDTTTGGTSTGGTPTTAPTTAPGGVCGDGVVDPGEQCDDGPGNADSAGCTAGCMHNVCGDGKVGPGEACDLGRLNSNTGDCTLACTLPACGDGFVQPGEQCDDGNRGHDDGCDAQCQLESSCGDGVVGPGEQCDDGDDVGLDGCEADCRTSIQQVVTGGSYTCILLATGAVRCWGDNTYGQLGYGHKNHLGDGPGELPTADLELGGPAIQITAGRDHACAVMEGGDVRCWGSNASTLLGNPNFMNNLGDQPGEMPPPVVNLGGPVTQIEAGRQHSCAVMLGGAVRCWGGGIYGALGIGVPTIIGDEPGEMPPQDSNVGAPAAQVVLGYASTCARLVDGRVRCWGYNNRGQLGDGTNENRGDEPGELPPPDVDLGGLVAVELASGEQHVCARGDDGSLRCWGKNDQGELGYGHMGDVGELPGQMPPPVVDTGGPVAQVYGGNVHTCVRMPDGGVRCWGYGGAGSLGIGYFANLGQLPGDMPPASIDLAGPVSRLTTEGGHGADHTCAILLDGALRCWGRNERGQLGLGNTVTLGTMPGHMPPPPVPAL